MGIEEALEKKLPLVVELDDVIQRPVAEIAKIEGTWIFADLGWDDPLNSGHPFHVLGKQIEGDGPWRAGKFTIRLATDEEAEEIEAWRQEFSKLDLPPEAFINSVRNSLIL